MGTAAPALPASAAAAAPGVADPFYYLANFRSVIDWVAERYPDLLAPAEQQFIAAFGRLGQAAQALLVRMVMRRGDHFRLSKLRYAEIGAVEPALAELAAAALITLDPPLEMATLCRLLTRAEVIEHLGDSSARSISKAELMQWLLAAHGTTSARPSQWCPRLADPICQLTVRPVCDVLRLLYFGNLYQDWSEFVLRDLGMVAFEQVALSAASRVFQKRQDVAVYQRLFHCREQLEQGSDDLAALVAQAEAISSDNPWLQQRCAKLRFLLGRQAERAGEFATACRLYDDNPWPEARLRHARALERQGDFSACRALVSRMLADPRNGAELQRARRMAARVSRQLDTEAPPRARRAAHPKELLTLPPAAARVERLAAAHFACDEAPVFYVENTLVNALFGLLCWEAIFAPLPGAFFHPFQAGPADLGQADFVTRRRERFARCLALLDSGAHAAQIRRRFREKQGLSNFFVAWGAIDETLLALALRCIPAAHLRVWFDYLLADLELNRSGLPDLIQFEPAAASYRLIEVKGPGDRLQVNQQRWLEVFARHGHPYLVCHVAWQA